MVFPGSTSVNPGTRLVKAPSYPGILADDRRAFRVLAALKPDISLAAHGSFLDLEGKRSRAEGVSAFVDPAGYRERIASETERFEKLVADEERRR